MRDWERALQDLREQFIRGSPERFDRIVQALERLEADKTDAEALSDLRAEFHGLSGLGGTYRFPRVTALGSEGERACDAFLSSGTDPAQADIDSWRSLLKGLRSEIGGEATSRADESVEAASPRVLLAAEDSEEEASLRMVLESAGYEVRAANPAQFEAALQSFSPDLVLVGAVAPNVSLCDLSPRPKGKSDSVAPPILFLTTGMEHGVHIAAGDDHLVKPVSPGLLLSKVAALIERARSPRGLASPAEPRQP